MNIFKNIITKFFLTSIVFFLLSFLGGIFLNFDLYRNSMCGGGCDANNGACYSLAPCGGLNWWLILAYGIISLIFSIVVSNKIGILIIKTSGVVVTFFASLVALFLIKNYFFGREMFVLWEVVVFSIVAGIASFLAVKLFGSIAERFNKIKNS